MTGYDPESERTNAPKFLARMQADDLRYAERYLCPMGQYVGFNALLSPCCFCTATCPHHKDHQ